MAKEVELKDPFENMGAKLIKEVASRTSDKAGDGTTTATVLAEAIIEEGFKLVAAGANPTALKRGVDKAVAAAVESITKFSRPVKGTDDIAKVGAISANNDAAIGKLLADAMDKVGKDGVITVEEGKGIETAVEVVEGMQFDRGFISPYFITKPQTREAVLEDCLILIHEKKLSNLRELLPLLEKTSAPPASPCCSSPRTWRAKRSPPSSSTSSAASSTVAPSRPRASATAGRPCSRIWASSPAAIASPKTSASNSRTSPSPTSARPAR